MTTISPKTKGEILNQFINLFWTALCFAPILWFWIKQGINLYFYLSLAVCFITVLLPEKILNLFLLSSNRKLYERLGVKYIRKFVQNGDIVKSITDKQRRFTINGVAQARQYLKIIAMYERYHWACFTFFLLTTINCFLNGSLKLGLAMIAVNILYNISSILLQQYNKIRIKRIITGVGADPSRMARAYYNGL